MVGNMGDVIDPVARVTAQEPFRSGIIDAKLDRQRDRDARDAAGTAAAREQ